jgi:hypothetical protein
MGIFDNTGITLLQQEETLYESKYGLFMEGKLATPVYLYISTKRIMTLVDISLLNPKNLILRYLPFSRLWIRKEWELKSSCMFDELVSIERYKCGLNNKLIKFNKSNGDSFILGLGGGKSFEAFFSFIEAMLARNNRMLNQESETVWLVA